MLRQPLTDQPRGHVLSTPRAKPDDETHRSRWIGLRPRNPRDSWQDGRARDQTQKLAARKFHRSLPGRGRLDMRTAGEGTRRVIHQIGSKGPHGCMISTEALKGKALFSDRGIRLI